MFQFRLSDLIFATFFAGLFGLAYRLGLFADPWPYDDLWIRAGIAVSIIGVICLCQDWDAVGHTLIPAAPFWVAARCVQLQTQSLHIIGCCGFSENYVAGLAEEVWDQGSVGMIVVGMTLIATLWIAFRRNWNFPWLLILSLTICWIQLLLLSSGIWIVIRIGFGYIWVGG